MEDDGEAAGLLERRLTREGYEVEVMSDPVDVVDRISLGIADWEVVVLDVGLPKISGIELLKILKQHGSMASIVMLTADDSAYTATMCMRAGAFHYLTKPVEASDISIVVDSAQRFSIARRRMLERPGARVQSQLIGDSPAMRKLDAAIDQVARQEVSVLLRGESGTGKELAARSIHDRSERRERKFVAVNCSSIPETLIDSELFGHARGAFTGAVGERAGVFVEADGGTLFLDEIGDMPLHVQARLLRALQEGEIRPVGSSGTR